MQNNRFSFEKFSHRMKPYMQKVRLF